MDLERYRSSAAEQGRWEDLLRLLPRGQRSILEIGARDGHHSRLLADHFESVTALDLVRPAFAFDRVVTVQGDVTALQFPDAHFDCVLCAEVLEHVTDVRRAASEIARVAKYDVVIGVPFREDTRVGKLTCANCGKVSPPYGHINTFDEARLRSLFDGLAVTEVSLVGPERERTNPVSSWLMTQAGNPFGTYDQDEPCVHCGQRLHAPRSRQVHVRLLSRAAVCLDSVQRLLARRPASWIHMRLSRRRETR
jgi:SAM-dependent methyltransferase